MKKLYFITLLLLTACSAGHLYKPGMTQASFDRDSRACMYQADLAAAGMSSDDPIGSGLRKGELHNECMNQKGYIDVD